MAFEIKMSPSKKPNSQSSPGIGLALWFKNHKIYWKNFCGFLANLGKVSLRQKTKPNVPRPHTVHLERSTVCPEKEDEERTRTFSDSQEQDENKPPAEVFKLF